MLIFLKKYSDGLEQLESKPKSYELYEENYR